MKILKRINHLLRKLVVLAIIVLALGNVSCNQEEMLELVPYNQISEAVAFTTPSTIELSVIGMYNAAQLGFYGGTPRGYPFGAAFVQQGDARGEDVVITAAFFRFTYTNTINAASTFNNIHHWNDIFRLINRINIILDGVQTAATNGVISQAVADRYIGEALLLRAFSYHELLIHFARPFRHTADASHPGVPIHRRPFTTQAAIEEGMATGRSSVAEVYAFILDDLNRAETLLPTRLERSGNFGVSRGTKGAAAALKTRIHQHMWNMPGVITEALKFAPGGVYATHNTMEANPWNAFVSDYTSSENIFGMENSATTNPGVNGALANMYRGRNVVVMSPILWRHPRWLADDLRRGPQMIFTADGRPQTLKYNDNTTFTDLSPMLRLPEVFLNLAEAYARQGDVTNALTYLNLVRNRSLANPATQAYDATTFANNIALLEAILAERRIEFAMEGRRWPDIHRLQQCPHFPIAGIPAKVAESPPVAMYSTAPITFGVAAVPYASHLFVWPIPQDEINANPTLAGQQNPGW